MKCAILSVLVAVCLVGVAQSKLQCEIPPANVPQEWRDMSSGCINKVKEQIQKEIDASMTYLAMGAHFSRDTVNRPGFAKFFFESAAEEREHGHKLIEYLMMRGELVNAGNELQNLISIKTPGNIQWVSGLDALKAALRKEASVTLSIREVIAVCEDDKKNDKNFNDYHIVDYLTGVYLEEQYHGQRALAGKISTLEKMMKENGEIAEFLFDKKNF